MNPETPPGAEEHTQQAGGGAGSVPPQPGADEESTAEELLDLLKRLRERVEPVGKDFLAWVKAEARLRDFEVRERVRLAITRIALLLFAVLPGITAWVFLNVTVWRVAEAATGLSWTAPLAVTVLNAGVAFIILARVGKLHL